MCPPLVFGAQKKPGLDRVKLLKGAFRFDGKRTEACHIRDAQSSDWTAWVYREVSPRQDSSWHQEERNFFTLCGWGSWLLKPGADGSGDTGCRPRYTQYSMYVRSSWFSPSWVWHHSGTEKALADMLLGWLEDKQFHTPQCSQLSGYWWCEKLIQDYKSMSKCGLFGVLFKKISGASPGPQADQ